MSGSDRGASAPGAPPVIERAGPAAASAVHAFMRACAVEMRREGFHNWDAPPAPERLAALAGTRTLLLVRVASEAAGETSDGTLAGAVFVGDAPIRPYDAALAAGDVRWAAPDDGPANPGPAAYVNALAVHPDHQGRGL